MLFEQIYSTNCANWFISATSILLRFSRQFKEKNINDVYVYSLFFSLFDVIETSIKIQTQRLYFPASKMNEKNSRKLALPQNQNQNQPFHFEFSKEISAIASSINSSMSSILNRNYFTTLRFRCESNVSNCFPIKNKMKM